MKAGDRWELVVPPELGFKTIPYGSKVTPGATLIYDLKITSVIPAEGEQSRSASGRVVEPEPVKPASRVGKE